MAEQHRSEPDPIGPATPVALLMTRAVARIAPDASLHEVARKLVAVGAGALAIGTTDAVTAVVSERDITRAIGLDQDGDAVTAADIGSSDLIWCRPQDTALGAARVMAERGVRHLLVGDAAAGHLIGIVSARDLIVALAAGCPDG